MHVSEKFDDESEANEFYKRLQREAEEEARSRRNELNGLERRLRLNEAVMRVLTVEYVPPELTQPKVDAEALAAAEEAADD